MQSLTLSPPLIQLFANGFTRLSGHAIFNTVLPEWRNWQTQQTQNLPGITPRVGSTPSSGTNLFNSLLKDSRLLLSRCVKHLYTFCTLARKLFDCFA